MKRGIQEMMSKECANDIRLRKEDLLLSSKSQVVTPGVTCSELRMPGQSQRITKNCSLTIY